MIVVISLSVGLYSCRTLKSVAETKIEENRNIENDIAVINSALIHEAINSAVQTAIKDRLNISANLRKYDTEKPVNPETGKPPLKEEVDMTLSQETDTIMDEHTDKEKSEETNSQLIDKSIDKTKTEIKEKVKQKSGLTTLEKTGICTLISLFLGLIIFLIRKFRK